MMVKRKLDGAVNESSADQQYITCEKSGGLHLAEPGLKAGRQADKIWARLEISKAYCRSKYSIFRFFLAKVLHCLSNFDAFLMLF